MTPSLRIARLLPLVALAAGATWTAAAVAATPAPGLDVGRYLGRWYVISRFPAGEPHPRGAYFEFTARGDGEIQDRYSAREGAFEREPAVVERSAAPDPSLPSRWKVDAGWLDVEERWVLYVSPDYRFALAGVPGLEAGWMLARDPVIPEWRYAGLLARLAMQGYDVSKFRRVPQKPEQVGLPGYE